LPVLSYVHKGELEYLMMTKLHGEHLWALRVWPDSTSALKQWSATVTRHKRDTDLWFFHHWGYVDTVKNKSVLMQDFKEAGLSVKRINGEWQIGVSLAPQKSR